MATQAYYGGGEYESFHRPLHRSTSTAAYYDRPAPYGYYDQPRHDLRTEYGHGGRPVTRAMIQEPEQLDIGPGGSRRRIAVACSRCRRRKIKCSGNPGDGSGCQACRASGTDVSACTFDRVGSAVLPLTGAIEAYPAASSASSAPTSNGYNSDVPPSSGWNQGSYLHSRPSLPTLHTRASWVDHYDGYENSPVDAYTYAPASIPRQDSFASTYGPIENYRSWSTTAPLSAPVTASYCNEQQSAYSFGNLQAPSYTASVSQRLPSVTADSFSLGSLHSSLPAQTAHERRLPVPYTIQYPTPTYTAPQIPPVKPLNSYNESRAPIHGIHSRTAMPWSMDSIPSSTRTTSSASSYVPMLPYAQPAPTHRQAAAAPIAEQQFGYQFNHQPAKISSPDVSPTSGPTYSESFSSTALGSNGLGITTSMAPPTSFRYASVVPVSQPPPEEPPATACGSRDAAPTASLYSFSTDNAAETPAPSDANDLSGVGTPSAGTYLPPLRHTQPQHHSLSNGSVRKQPSFDQQQQQRATTAHRMSVSNLSRQY